LTRRWDSQTVVIRLVVGVIVFGAGVELAKGSTLITFDDLTPRTSDKIPRPYHGLVFSGDPYNGIFKSSTSAIPGVRNGAVSSPNVLLSAGQSNSIQGYRPADRAVFTLHSGYFTSAYDAFLTVEALGFTPNDTFNHPTFKKTFSISNADATLITFEWAGIMEVELTGSYAPFSRNQYVLDNLVVDTSVPEPASTPEPKTAALIYVGLAMFYVRVRSRDVPQNSAWR